MLHLTLPPNTTVVAPLNPAGAIRTAVCCLALREESFSLSDYKWINSQIREPYDPDFYVPYAEYRGMVYMKSWAFGGLGRIKGAVVGRAAAQAIEPESFHAQLIESMRGFDADVQAEARRAFQFATVEGARNVGYEDRADQLEMLYAKVHNACIQDKLVVDQRLIKRRLCA